MRKIIILLCMAVMTATLAACTTTTPVLRNSLPPSTASAAEINKAKQGAKEQMKDPGSVQFRNVRGYNKGGADAVLLCGELNAKNSFGGYAGFKYFTYLAGHMFLSQPVEGCEICENPFNKYWNESCKP